MASNIKGITIKIGGDTTDLKKSLKDVESSATKTSSEIKQIDKALKFDPSNVVLLGQKQELLGKQINTTREKLERLKNAQAEVQAQFEKGDIAEEKYRAFQREIEVTQNVLKGYEGQLANVNKALSSNGGATDDSKAKLTALQTEQSRLSSESEKVVSSFKLQESQLGRNASEADKLALAEKKVAAQTDIVKQQIGNLERQLELTKQEYGENSVQANKMETELNQAKSTLNALNNELRETGGASNTAQSGMEDMANIMRAEALAQVSEKLGEISQKLLEVGWKSMEAAASLQASNAQFSTVFGDLESQARSSLDKIGSDLQIVPERLQGSFTQMAAFAKTAGFETADALDLTERATRAAADGAAFYDKSIEEVTENLQSFLKGNFANDAALGISATETTRNAMANELYGQSFKDLSEAQKQLTLLAMVEDGNKVSGALGQASREADGFENILGNLKQSGENAMAALGQPILEAMIPVFKMMSEVVQNVARWFTNLARPIKQAIVVFGGVITVIGLLLPFFLALKAAAMAMETTIAGMLSAFAPIVGTVLAVAAVIAILVAGIMYLWETNEGFRKIVTEIWQAILAVINSVVQEISDFVQSVWGQMTSWWQENQELIQATTKKVWGAISKIVSVAIKVLGPMFRTAFKNIQTVVTAAWKIIQTIIQGTLKNIMGIIKAVMQAINGDWSGAWNSIQEVARNTFNMVRSIIQTALSAILSVFTNSWNTMLSVLSNVFSGIISLAKTTWSNLTAFLSSTWSNIASTASNNWNAILTSLQFIWNSLYNAAMTIFNSTKDFIANIWNTISSTASSIWNGITSFLGGIWNGILSTASNIFNTIRDTIANVWNSVSSTASNVWNGIKNTIANAINAIKGLFNFEWSLPRVKVPKFNISGGQAPWGLGGEGTPPSIGITWQYFAKGGILTKPTVFGMNGNTAMVGGEAGAEAVLPLNERTLGMIADRIMATVTDKIVVNVPEQQPQPIILNIDGKTFAQLMVGHISELQADRLRIVEAGGTI